MYRSRPFGLFYLEDKEWGAYGQKYFAHPCSFLGLGKTFLGSHGN